MRRRGEQRRRRQINGAFFNMLSRPRTCANSRSALARLISQGRMSRFELPTPADKAAALEAMLTAELAEDDPGFLYRLLGERLQKIKEHQEAGDEATATRLRELEAHRGRGCQCTAGAGTAGPHATRRVRTLHDTARPHLRHRRGYISECARKMLGHLRQYRLLVTGWSNSRSSTAWRVFAR